ncbi:hypothetical protein ACH47Z_42675 [Streptomyces sp. NPDC020192]|uniref:hypothetical protein n=1 Tax=Streptomyces sp. NPDC020192 TaxID=3365066 RepID=UPI003795C2DD
MEFEAPATPLLQQVLVQEQFQYLGGLADGASRQRGGRRGTEIRARMKAEQPEHPLCPVRERLVGEVEDRADRAFAGTDRVQLAVPQPVGQFLKAPGRSGRQPRRRQRQG